MSCQIKGGEQRETYVLTWPRGARRRGRGRDGPGSEVPATNARGQCAEGGGTGPDDSLEKRDLRGFPILFLSLHSFQAVPMKEESRLRRRVEK